MGNKNLYTIALSAQLYILEDVQEYRHKPVDQVLLSCSACPLKMKMRTPLFVSICV